MSSDDDQPEDDEDGRLTDVLPSKERAGSVLGSILYTFSAVVITFSYWALVVIFSIVLIIALSSRDILGILAIALVSSFAGFVAVQVSASALDSLPVVGRIDGFSVSQLLVMIPFATIGTTVLLAPDLLMLAIVQLTNDPILSVPFLTEPPAAPATVQGRLDRAMIGGAPILAELTTVAASHQYTHRPNSRIYDSHWAKYGTYKILLIFVALMVVPSVYAIFRNGEPISSTTQQAWYVSTIFFVLIELYKLFSWVVSETRLQNVLTD